MAITDATSWLIALPREGSFGILAALDIESTSSMKNDVLKNEAIRKFLHGLGQGAFGSNDQSAG
jgi:predicted outer membrane lipoprotein